MKPSEFLGRTLVPLKGRFLVWLSDGTNVSFVPSDLKNEVPLFSTGGAGRFLIEGHGFLAFPENLEYNLYDTGKPYERFEVDFFFTNANKFVAPAPAPVTDPDNIVNWAFNRQRLNTNVYFVVFGQGSTRPSGYYACGAAQAGPVAGQHLPDYFYAFDPSTPAPAFQDTPNIASASTQSESITWYVLYEGSDNGTYVVPDFSYQGYRDSPTVGYPLPAGWVVTSAT